MKMKVGAAALLMCLVTANQAFAGYVTITPPPTPAIPEFDGPGAIAAVALLASAVAIAFHRSRNR
jgi:hypothetical protein